MMKPLLLTSILILILYTTATAQWEQSNGPTGGYITQIIEDSNGVLFASTGWGGIVRSANGGDIWMQADQGLTWPGGGLVANEYAVFTASNGVARSFDAGETWEESNNGLDNHDVGSLAVNSQGHVYAGVLDGTGGASGIYISEDNGDSWIFKPLNAPAYMESIAVAVNDSNHIFVGGPGILLRSLDNGDSWEDISPDYGFYKVRTIVFDSAGTVYVGVSLDGGLYRSDDNGQTWTKVMTDEIYSLSINSENEIFAAAATGIYKSSNGTNWVLLDNVPPVSVSCLHVSGDDTLYAGCYGIYRSYDEGNSWEKSSNGLVSTIVWSLDATATGTLFAITDSLWRSTDNGQNWENVSDGYFSTNIESVIIAADNGVEYVLANDGFEGKLYQSIDDGNTWQLLFTGSNIFNDVKVNSNGDIFIATENDGVWRSTDGGVSFTLTGFNGESAKALVIGNQGTILVSMESSPYYVYRSEDNGDSWSTSYTMFSWGGAKSLETDSAGYFYMASYDELLRSADDGLSWENITQNFPSYSITAIETGELDTLYVATRDDGIFKSGDRGDTWEPYNEGLPPYGWVNSIVVSPATGYIYAGYHGKGVWLRGYDDVNVPAFFAERPVSGISVYPNPASSHVTVKYNAYKANTIAVVGIRDLNGRLLKEMQLTGTETSLPLDGLSKGLYFVAVSGKSGGEKLIVE